MTMWLLRSGDTVTGIRSPEGEPSVLDEVLANTVARLGAEGEIHPDLLTLIAANPNLLRNVDRVREAILAALSEEADEDS